MIVGQVIEELVPGAKYFNYAGTTEAEFNEIRWHDDRPKPTWDEIKAEWKRIKKDVELQRLRDGVMQTKGGQILEELIIAELKSRGEWPE